MVVLMYSLLHMLQEILDIVRRWDVWGQFFFVIIIATFGTGIGVAIIGLVGDFINNTLPILIRGYPKKDDADDADEDDKK